jgi:cbb3-type cytochrome oxidase maturation protein
MNTYHFFTYWLLFSLLVLAGSAAFFWWAYRAGHFRDQDRARHLALWAEVPEEKIESTKNDEVVRTQDLPQVKVRIGRCTESTEVRL